MFRIPFFVVLTACNPVYLAPGSSSVDADRASLGECRPLGGTFSGVAFTDEEAHNAIDFADNATGPELEAMLGIGPSIANRIVTARPYGTQASPLAALDMVSYVGPVLLERFRTDTYALWCSFDDGRQGCCIDLACEGLGGEPAGVVFDDAEAQMVLDWANRATFDELDAVCGIGEAIATDIVAARPLHALDELDGVPYVGPSALHRMLGDEGWDCVTRATVAEVWCVHDDACVCDTGAETEPPAQVEDIGHESTDGLPAAIVAAVDALVGQSDLCDPAYAGPTELVGLVEHRVDGVTTGYTVHLSQDGWFVVVDLDADGTVLGTSCAGL